MAEMAHSSCFVMVGGWRTSQTQRTHPYRCVLHGWEEGMGVEVLEEGGGNVSRHEKKRKKRRAYLVHPAHCFPVPLLAPPGPCVFHHVCHVFDASQPPHFMLSCCCQQGHLGGISGPFQHSWGIMWCILALT